jgi:hypothetical protein
MKIFDRDGGKGWRSLRQWDCIVSNIVDASIVRKKGLWAKPIKKNRAKRIGHSVKKSFWIIE